MPYPEMLKDIQVCEKITVGVIYTYEHFWNVIEPIIGQISNEKHCLLLTQNMMRCLRWGVRSWRKIRASKRVFLYAPTHGFTSSIATYLRPLIDLFKDKGFANYGLILRFHPLFWDEVLHSNLWSKDDINEFENYIRGTENIVFDRN